MKTAFAGGSTKTAFQFRSDYSLTVSFSEMLDSLPSEKNASIEILNTYKQKLIPKNYRGSYKRIILKILDQLMTTVTQYGIGFGVQALPSIKLNASAKLTVNELYQGYLDGTNDGEGIDEVMLAILDEIKSASMV